ncbi:MAG: FAD-binding protein [Planctomycetia bacterium]|nr:FAD-binding protein [Planctomycetia bacterium]
MHKGRRVSRHAISRRRFSHMAALAALSIAGRRAVAAPRAGGTALVVGAGMAGLAAAIDLKAAGWTVVVIEGRDRVGGRIFTDRHGCDVDPRHSGQSHQRPADEVPTQGGPDELRRHPPL